MPRIGDADSAVATVGPAVVRPSQSVAARLLIVNIGDAVRPCIVRQHADAMGQGFVGRYVHALVACRSTIQNLGDVGKVLPF